MYKTTIKSVKYTPFKKGVSESITTEIDAYIENFTNEGWYLVSMAALSSTQYLFVWKKD